MNATKHTDESHTLHTRNVLSGAHWHIECDTAHVDTFHAMRGQQLATAYTRATTDMSNAMLACESLYAAVKVASIDSVISSVLNGELLERCERAQGVLGDALMALYDVVIRDARAVGCDARIVCDKTFGFDCCVHGIDDV